MDINRRQELIQIYDEKLDTPDRCPHCYVANWTYITADWIKSLDETDRASVYEYIDYILNRAGEFPQKLRTVMMLADSLPGNRKTDGQNDCGGDFKTYAVHHAIRSFQ